MVGASSSAPPVKSSSWVGVVGLLAAGQWTRGAEAENVIGAADESRNGREVRRLRELIARELKGFISYCLSVKDDDKG